MAKQQGYGYGVVGAAARVSNVQGAFQDRGKQFMAGYNKALEAKKQKEAANKEIQNRVNTLMGGFKNDIDVLKFKPEDQTLVKNTIVKWRDEYAEAANIAAKIEDKSSAEYQAQMDILNGIVNRMANLKSNLDNLAAFKKEYSEGIEAGAYSNAGANSLALAQGETMFTNAIGSISDTGDLMWGPETGSVRDGFSFQDYKKPFMKAVDAPTEWAKIAAPYATQKAPLTPSQKTFIKNQIEKIASNPDTVASLISDSDMPELDFSDIDPEDPNARQMVVDRMTQAAFDQAGSAVVKEETPGGGGGGSRRSRYKMPETVQAMIEVQEDARAEGPKMGVEEPADVISKEAKIFSLGPSDNPEQIRVKMDPSTKKWIYYNAKLDAKAEYDNLLELMNAHPKVFYNS